MKIERLPYDPDAAADFFEESLTALGALCSRTWHDRLEVVAEGKAATLWNPEGALHSIELQMAPPESASRDAATEVFPGCPLTFRMAEMLLPSPPTLERVALAADARIMRPPDPAVADKLWRSQWPDTARWRLGSAFQPCHHFSLIALARCEILSIDQQWSLRRLALSLPDGRRDEGLARELGFAQPGSASGIAAWPTFTAERAATMLRAAIEEETREDVAEIRARQQARLERELARVDTYFSSYERELRERVRRSKSGAMKLEERLAAAGAEHARLRADQLTRHEIHVIPHIDALLLVAEPAMRAKVEASRAHQPAVLTDAVFIPRARRWEVAPSTPA